MKNIIIISFLLVCLHNSLSAQQDALTIDNFRLTVKENTTLSVKGNIVVKNSTVSNSNIHNEGLIIWVQGSTGKPDTLYKLPDSTPLFYSSSNPSLDKNKAAGSFGSLVIKGQNSKFIKGQNNYLFNNISFADTVRLGTSIKALGTVSFNKGILDLNGDTLFLYDLSKDVMSRSGSLINEDSVSHSADKTQNGAIQSNSEFGDYTFGNLGFEITNLEGTYTSANLSRVHRSFPGVTNGSIQKYYQFTPIGGSGFSGSITAKYLGSDFKPTVGNRSTMGVFFYENQTVPAFELLKSEFVTAHSVKTKTNNNLKAGIYTIADTNCINPPLLHFSKPEYSICSGDSVIITCDSVTRNGIKTLPLAWYWSESQGNANILKLINVSASKTISLRVITSDGCRVTQQVSLKVNERPQTKIKIINYKTSYCQKDSVIITDEVTHTNGSYIWSPFSEKYTGSEYHYSPGTITSNILTEIIAKYTDTNGCSSKSSVTVNFLADPKPVFAFSDSSICMDKELEIKNYTNGNGIKQYVWYPGNSDSILVTKDAVTIHGAVPIDTSGAKKIVAGMPSPGLNLRYHNPGNFQVQLKAINYEGCSGLASIPVTIFPSVEAGIKMISNDTVCLGNRFTFCASDTTGKTKISKYRWIIFDHPNASVPTSEIFKFKFNDTIQFNFATPGPKKIGLEVFSEKGCSNYTTFDIYVAPKPVAHFKVTPVCTNSPTLIRNSSSKSHGERYLWQFEATTIEKTDTTSFTHTFNTAGNNKILLKVINTYGCSDTVTNEAIVWPLPKAIIETRNACLNAQENDTLLVNHSKDATTFNWMFGDGTVSQLPQPLKKYNEAKTYQVMLQVGNNYGCSSKVTENITVYEVIEPTITVSEVCSGNATVFTGAGGAYQYEWDFGDGIKETSMGKTISHTYKKPGIYSSQLILKTENNCISQVKSNAKVHSAPAAKFTANTVCIGEPTVFELSDSTSLNQNCNYFWDFGDNTFSNEKTPSHTYKQNGKFDAALTVSSANGCITKTSTVAIIDSLPVSHFGNFEGTCNDYLTLSAKNPDCSYLWNNNSTADTLRITKSGNYSVTITNKLSGCRATYSTEVKLRSKILPQLEDKSFCGQAVVKTPVSGASYLWNNGQNTQSITIKDTGKHIISVIVTKDGCQGYDTATINIYPLPVFDLGVNKALCFGDKVTLNAAPSNLIPKTFTWISSDPDEGTGDQPFLNIINTSVRQKIISYTVMVTSLNKCIATDNIELTFKPRIPVELGSDAALCAGQSKLLDAMSAEGIEYTWNDGYISPSRTIKGEISDNNPEEKIWWVKVTDNMGCTAFDTIKVKVSPNPKITLAPDYTLCSGDTLILNASQSDIAKYFWEPMASVSPVLRLFNKTNTIASQPLRLELTNIYGCTASSDWVDVKFKETPTKELPTSLTACNIALLNAGNSGATFTWSNGQTSQYQYVRNTGTYTVRITNAANCSIYDSVKVNILNIAKPNLGGTRTVCANDEIELTSGINNPDYSFLWSNNSTASKLRVSASGKYWLRVTHVNGCIESDTVLIQNKPAPSVDLGPDADLCSEEFFPVTTNAKGSFFYWGSSNPEYEQTTSSGYIEINKPGKYWVKVVNADGCEASDTINIQPTSNPIHASFLAVSKFKTGDSIQFLDMSYPNAVKWFWDFGDMRVSRDQDPLHIYYSCDTFKVLMNVSNGFCQASLVKDVIVTGCTKSGRFEHQLQGNGFVKIKSSRVYPNPVRDHITLDVELTRECDIRVFIFNLMGTLEKSDIIPNAQLISKQYYLDNLKPGVYLVKIIAAGDQKTYKIVKI